MPASGARREVRAGLALTVDAARLRTLAATAVLRDAETLALDAALGRVLASPVRARIDLPPFDNSAMDGYAVASSGLTGEGPWRLPVARRAATGGKGPEPLPEGAALRIQTGAPVPAGADAVVMHEHVVRVGREIILKTPVMPGLNIRRQGEDRRAGDVALDRGCNLTAARLGLLAGCGQSEVSVVRRLRVGLFSAGNELRDPGEALAPGHIYNSNRVMLRALLARPWITLTDYGIVRDEAEAIGAALGKAAAANDVVISSGGISAGQGNHTLETLPCGHAAFEVLQIAIRPGKPLTVGRVGEAIYIGLPGNPYAAAITFAEIAQPALRKAAGLTVERDVWFHGVAGFHYRRRSGRREYIPVAWSDRDGMGRPVLKRLGQGASARLSPLALAQGIAVVPPDLSVVVPGTVLRVDPVAD